MKHGYIRVAAAIPEVKVANCEWNSKQIIDLMQLAEQQQVEVLAFPELSVTAYTCADLFFQNDLLEKALNGLQQILLSSCDLNVIAVIGMPLRIGQQLFNTAVVVQRGQMLAIVPKTHLPNHNEFYEKRWFASASSLQVQSTELLGQIVPVGTDLLVEYGNVTIGIEICEDVWVPVPPSVQAALQGAGLLVNLSASNELAGKNVYLRQLIEQQSARINAAYLYASAGFGESSTDLVYTGNALVAENGQLVAESERFSFTRQLVVTEVDYDKLMAERLRNTNFFNDRGIIVFRRVKAIFCAKEFDGFNRSINPHPFVPVNEKMNDSCEEIFSIQAAGLAQRWQHTKAQTLVLGISGGLDSTLALLVCVRAADRLGYDRRRIIGITMPGFGTTDRTYSNAVALIQSLGVDFREINIRDAALQHFSDIGHDASVHDITYENTQARERTQILMDVANQTGGLVVGTGDLSELALGWATYNGDHMSMYGVNSGVPKTLVRYLVNWASQNEATSILQDILSTPVSPELLPAGNDGTISQKTEDIVGPYELHDFFLYYTIRFGFNPDKILFLALLAFKEEYDRATIVKWQDTFRSRFYNQQFKRSCMPDGPKVGSINLSPRGDWRMPSDAYFNG
jgi:NAD+ synthase (glutamine-hydrolysing)